MSRRVYISIEFWSTPCDTCGSHEGTVIMCNGVKAYSHDEGHAIVWSEAVSSILRELGLESSVFTTPSPYDDGRDRIRVQFSNLRDFEAKIQERDYGGIGTKRIAFLKNLLRFIGLRPAVSIVFT